MTLAEPIFFVVDNGTNADTAAVHEDVYNDAVIEVLFNVVMMMMMDADDT